MQLKGNALSMNRNISRSPSLQSGRTSQHARSFGTLYRQGEHPIASIAEESIVRDLEDEEIEEQVQDDEDEDDDDVENSLDRVASHDPPLGEHSLVGMRRRPSHMSIGQGHFLGLQQSESGIPLEQDRGAALTEERILLSDNNLILPSHPRRDSQTSSKSASWLRSRISVPGFSTSRRRSDLIDEESGPSQSRPPEPSEITALLPDNTQNAEADPETIDKKWEEAVLAGQIHTTWRRESKVLLQYTAPLTLTFILQISLTLTSIFTVGHISKNELGAVSLGSMTANITGYAVYPRSRDVAGYALRASLWVW